MIPIREAGIGLLNALTGVVTLLRPTYLIGLWILYKIVEMILGHEMLDKEVMIFLVGTVLGGIIASNGKLLDGPDPMAVLLGKAIDKLGN